MRRLLHVGCGPDVAPDWLGQCEETRLDVDPNHSPDVCASMLAMGDIGAFDALYCNHALEHLHPHEIPAALSEFRRVLRDGGVAVVFVPNLEGLAPTDDVLYEAPCGPVTARDLFYGHRDYTARNPWMAHKTGFVPQTLRAEFEAAGFSRVEIRPLADYNLICAAVK
jgi:ubiquinone/menaquinone biosynthesis C-methylase UbiE